MTKDLIIALSLANLCMIRGWGYVFAFSPLSHYYMKYPSTINHFTAVMIIILLLAGILFIAITLARRSANPTIMKTARVVILVVLTIPLNEILLSINLSKQNYLSDALITLILLALSLAMIIYRRNRKSKLQYDIFQFLKKALLIMFAFLLFNISCAVWLLLNIEPSTFKDKPLSAVLNTDSMSHPRVLLLIFDEMSQYLVFDARPAKLELPQLDRFKNQSVYTCNSYPPGGETDISLPSLITGRMVSKSEPLKPDEMMITFEGENQPERWSTTPNLFSEAYELGINSSVIGWYHPYGRLFGGSLASCSWYPYDPYRKMNLAETLVVQVCISVDVIPFGRHLRLLSNIFTLEQQCRYNNYLDIKADTKKAVCNPDYGLIFVHWPVPHPPGIYDRESNDFRLKGGSYVDNLALVDKTLGEIRRSMEDAGTWENTTVIITSDHWWRDDVWSSKVLWTDEDEAISLVSGNDNRVPFLIKMAGQKDTVHYDQEFNTVVIHDLIIELLKNNLSEPEEVVNWINVNKVRYSIPDYKSSDK